MRLLILIFAAIALTAQTQVQTVACGSTSATHATCNLAATGSGNLIVLVYESSVNSLPPTIGDSASQTYTFLNSVSDNCQFAGTRCGIAIKCGTASGVTSVTVTNNASGTGPVQAIVEEWSGIVSSSCLDQSATSNTVNATWTTNSVTTTQAAELVWGFGDNRTHASSGAITISTGGFTTSKEVALSSAGDIKTGFRIVSSTGTYQMGGTTTPAGDTIISSLASFKASATSRGSKSKKLQKLDF